MISIERTSEALLLKLPLDTDDTALQDILDYLEYTNALKRSKATQADVNSLAQDAKKGWWEKNKSRFIGQEGFEDFKD